MKVSEKLILDFGVTPEVAKEAARLIWEYRRGKSEFEDGDALLEFLDRALLGSHGVEGFALECDFRSGISYLNRGDTYDQTVILDPDGAIIVGMSWGDWLEAHEADCETCGQREEEA